MKKIFILALCLTGIVSGADAATVRRGGNTATNQTATTQPATAARAARRTTAAAPAANTAVAARSATAPRTTSARSAAPAAPTVAARSATTARAATKQKVIGTGTKVSGAVKNTVVSEECQQKYEGCMDAFCMLDNETGGRCICSDKNAEFDSILAEIEKLDQQSYKMATAGVERIEMGADANAAIAAANAVADEILNEEVKSGRKALDLSMWDMTVDMDESEDIFGTSGLMSPIEGKEGDALHAAAAEICVQQIPECSADISMLRMMYAQKVRSDCAAYENSLKQQKNASATKLAAAEKALRDAALEQYRSANKYDLGQCTIQFKSCMIKTGGCGEDFSKCASVVASDNTRAGATAAKGYKIKGAVASIEISASTYDTLIAKKPLCEYVTKNCVDVADQVWDTFIREVAPQVKSAEIIAEDNARQNCISNISDCFQKACKDNIDASDPDGSYDMCLTRPETMLNVCKIPLNACGIDADPKKAQESQIWGFVTARLASIRVDSCTKAVKECLVADDRCGKDYGQCMGLDTDSIVRMCPYDKLAVSCQTEFDEVSKENNSQFGSTEDAFYASLEPLIQGIMLNIDNTMLNECQKAADEAMVKVCGDTENCDGLTTDENIGARSLEYKICEYVGKESIEDVTDGNAVPRSAINFDNCYASIDQLMDAQLGREESQFGTTRNVFNFFGMAVKRKGAGGITPEDEASANKFVVVIDGTIPWDVVGTATSADGGFDAVSIGDAEAALNSITISDEGKAKALSELKQLEASINNAINVLETDQQVQFCTTGRKVQGLATRGQDGEITGRNTIGTTVHGGARFPNLIDEMKGNIAFSALQTARENYDAKYAELQKRMVEDYASLAKRIEEIGDANSTEERREAARFACVGLGQTAADDKVSGGGALVGVSETNTVFLKEKITSTFNWETMVCQKCTSRQECTNVKRKNNKNKRWCKSWGDIEESCVDIQM